ncbi:MAG TPA: DUF5998 family protein [Propionibacteriaceae bacterium]|nr:DUF5998 family protein [Propionibacteriaceae bacterium]
MTLSSTLSRQLRVDIEACGYFPEFVTDSLALALGDEPALHHLVHQEATFMGDEIHRHLTVLVVTPTRLVALHTDEGAEEANAEDQAITTTETVPLTNVRSVSLSRVVQKPEHFDSRRPRVVETWLVLGWGVLGRVDMEPAGCSDPACEADHGYTGTITGDDLTIRMSPAADGAENVDRLIRFASVLQQAVGRAR